MASDERARAEIVAREVGAYVATRLLDDGVCGLCHEPLIAVGFRARGHHVEVLSCGPCGWHTRQIDGIDATLDEVREILGGEDVVPSQRRGRLPGTWDRH